MEFFKKIREMDEGSRRVVAAVAVVAAGAVALAIFVMYVSSILATAAPEAAEAPVSTSEFSFSATARGMLAQGYRSVAGALRNLFSISTSKTYEITP